MGSPTKRSLDLLRRNGWEPAIVEKWNQFAKRRFDVYGVIDVLGINGEQIIGVQATSASNQSARRTKILQEPRALLWLKSGGRLFIHGWRKSAKNNRWVCNEIEITASDFESA